MLAHPPSLGGSSGDAKHFRAQPVQLSKCGGSRELVAEPCATGSQTLVRVLEIVIPSHYVGGFIGDVPGQYTDEIRRMGFGETARRFIVDTPGTAIVLQGRDCDRRTVRFVVKDGLPR